ncbi:hypothetical protein [Streptomyces sp. NRRL S-920]|uniref:hypothetical protein n=1 Tax=Streptomyces sp. NRRL S-920 TaxID=1463921 RepID=UPI000A5ED341|nr:hypothetical protein [Streptomyces sp. NRRL S-920]
MLTADGFASTYRRVIATGRRSRRIPSGSRFVAYGRNGSHNSSHCATGNSTLMR